LEWLVEEGREAQKEEGGRKEALDGESEEGEGGEEGDDEAGWKEEDLEDLLLEEGWTFNTRSKTARKRIDFIFYTPQVREEEGRGREEGRGEKREEEGEKAGGRDGKGGERREEGERRRWKGVEYFGVDEAWVEEVEELTENTFPASDHRPLFAIFDLGRRE
jgi:hypothetical protein